MSNKNNIQKTCQIREKVNIPEIENKTLLDVDIKPIINKESKMESRIIYEGELELNFIFTANTIIDINSIKVKVPFQFNVNDISDYTNIEPVSTFCIFCA